MLPSRQHLVEHADDARYHGDPRPGKARGCVWHCTAGDTVGGARSWLDRKGAGGAPLPPSKRASYNYLIAKDGRIVRTVPLDVIAFHAGRSSWRGIPAVDGSLNTWTIGVAFANDNGVDDNPDDDELTEEQLASGLWLGVTLMKLEGYPASKNVGHCEVSPGRKFDPLPRILGMDQWRYALSEWG